MLGYLAAFGAAAVMIGIIAAIRRYELKRTAAMSVVAERRGWEFTPSVQFSTLPNLDRFELFAQGRARKVQNVMTSPAGDVRGVVFDFLYTTGGGNSRRIHRQTVLMAVSDALDLPTFSLRPQHFGHAVAKAFGYQDIDLPERPVFSKMFVLRSDDVPRVRELFSDPAVVEFFESREGVCAAGNGRELLFWRPGKRIPPEQVDALVADGFALARVLGGIGNG